MTPTSPTSSTASSPVLTRGSAPELGSSSVHGDLGLDTEWYASPACAAGATHLEHGWDRHALLGGDNFVNMEHGAATDRAVTEGEPSEGAAAGSRQQISAWPGHRTSPGWDTTRHADSGCRSSAGHPQAHGPAGRDHRGAHVPPSHR